MSVGIVGLGYVGLPLAVSFAEAGERRHRPRGERPPRGSSCAAASRTSRTCRRASSQAVSGRFEPTTRDRSAGEGGRDHRRVSRHRSRRTASPTSTPLVDAARRIADRSAAGPAGRPGVDHLPGHHARARCCRSSRSPACAPARDFHLAFSPERVDPGRDRLHAAAPRRRSSAASPRRARNARRGALRPGLRHARPRSPRSRCAEMAKLLENIFRSVNIALVNELAMLADRMGIDIWEVIDAAADQAARLHALRAGPGHGRPLPPRRPVLPVVEGARVRLLHRVHRARRQGQPAPCRTSASRRPSARSTTLGKPVKGSQDRASSASPTSRASATSARARR